MEERSSSFSLVAREGRGVVALARSADFFFFFIEGKSFCFVRYSRAFSTGANELFEAAVGDSGMRDEYIWKCFFRCVGWRVIRLDVER